MNSRSISLLLLTLMVVVVCVATAPTAQAQGCDESSGFGCGFGAGSTGRGNTGPGSETWDIPEENDNLTPGGNSGAARGGGYHREPDPSRRSKDWTDEVGAAQGSRVSSSIDTSADAGPTCSAAVNDYYRDKPGIQLSTPEVEQEVPPLWSLPPSAQSGSDMLESVAPATDPASVRAEADPVALQNGEFVYRAVDLEVGGGQIPFGLIRSYRSRIDFEGPFGLSWDHGLNARLFFSNDPTGSSITVSLGDLVPVRMRSVSQSGGGELYYPDRGGLNWSMQELSAPECHWRLSLPEGLVYCFTKDGFARSIHGLNNEGIRLEWEELELPLVDGEDPYFCYTSWEDKRVTKRLVQARRWLFGTETHQIRFFYHDMVPACDRNRNRFVVQSTLLQRAELWTVGDAQNSLEQISYAYDFPVGSWQLSLPSKNRLKSVFEGAADSEVDDPGTAPQLRERYEYEHADAVPERPIPDEVLTRLCDASCTGRCDTFMEDCWDHYSVTSKSPRLQRWESALRFHRFSALDGWCRWNCRKSEPIASPNRVFPQTPAFG